MSSQGGLKAREGVEDDVIVRIAVYRFGGKQRLNMVERGDCRIVLNIASFM